MLQKSCSRNSVKRVQKIYITSNSKVGLKKDKMIIFKIASYLTYWKCETFKLLTSSFTPIK